jgi:hypothetical protein
MEPIVKDILALVLVAAFLLLFWETLTGGRW